MAEACPTQRSHSASPSHQRLAPLRPPDPVPPGPSPHQPWPGAHKGNSWPSPFTLALPWWKQAPLQSHPLSSHSPCQWSFWGFAFLKMKIWPGWSLFLIKIPQQLPRDQKQVRISEPSNRPGPLSCSGGGDRFPGGWHCWSGDPGEPQLRLTCRAPLSGSPPDPQAHLVFSYLCIWSALSSLPAPPTPRRGPLPLMGTWWTPPFPFPHSQLGISPSSVGPAPPPAPPSTPCLPPLVLWPESRICLQFSRGCPP